MDAIGGWNLGNFSVDGSMLSPLPASIQQQLTTATVGGQATARDSRLAQSQLNRSNAHVAQDFESVLLSMMLKQLRTGMTEEGFFGEEGSDTLGGMFDMFMGNQLASTQPLGLGQVINSYLENQL